MTKHSTANNGESSAEDELRQADEIVLRGRDRDLFDEHAGGVGFEAECEAVSADGAVALPGVVVAATEATSLKCPPSGGFQPADCPMRLGGLLP